MTTPTTAEVLYEVEATLDPAIVADFDAWLPGHVSQVIACPGFTAAEIQALAAAGAGPPLRRVQYRLESQAALDRYLAEDAPRLRADGIARFGDKVSFSRRVLSPAVVPPQPPETPFECRNCGAAVRGRYCEECGQSRDIRVLSMSEVAGDVTHSLLHLDSRVWRTLRALVLSPGKLTNEFIAGRHQLYLPPFRLYLVISLLFFTLSALLPGAGILQTDGEDGTVIAAGPPSVAGGDAAEKGAAELEQVIGEISGGLADATKEDGTPEEAAGTAPPSDAAGPGACAVDFGGTLLAPFEARFEETCTKITVDSGRRLREIFLSNVPKLMFVFLPLMAAVAMLFYWRPRRLYAEHLVMFLHTHALLFLALGAFQLVEALLGWIAPRAPALADVADEVSAVALVVYLPWYVFRAMRTVYHNGRALTSFKLLVISMLYFVLLGVTFAVGMIYSVLSL